MPLRPWVSTTPITTSSPTASAAERLAQHAERFADTRSIPKEKLKDAA